VTLIKKKNEAAVTLRPNAQIQYIQYIYCYTWNLFPNFLCSRHNQYTNKHLQKHYTVICNVCLYVGKTGIVMKIGCEHITLSTRFKIHMVS